MTVHDRLEEVFHTVFNDDTLVLQDQMVADDIPGWDSVAHVNLMFAIEQAFGVRFKGNELGEFENIGELKAYLSRRS